MLNVYVEPAYRKRGIAKALMERAEADFQTRGVRFAILHSTTMGRDLYAGQDGNETTEMAKQLRF